MDFRFFGWILNLFRGRSVRSQDGYKMLLAKHIGLESEAAAEAMEEEPEHGLLRSLEHQHDILLPFAANRIGINLEVLRARFQDISLECPQERSQLMANARSEITRASYRILVNLPLMLFCWKMAKLWATRIGVMDIPGQGREETKFSFDETVSMASTLMQAFCDHRIQDVHVVSALQLSKNQTLFAGSVCHYSERFVVAHELGHVVIFYAPDRVKDLLDWTTSSSRRFLSPLLAKCPDWPKQYDENTLVRKWAVEYAADAIGMNLCISSAETELERIRAYWGAELLLITCAMIADFDNSKNRSHPYPLDSHPFALMRLAMLRNLVDKTTRPEVMAVAKGFEQMSKEVLRKLGITPMPAA